MNIHPLAHALNDEFQNPGCAVLPLLSQKGKQAYFPVKGILGQSAEARGKKINATIGTASEEDGSPLTLETLEDMLSLPSETFLYAPSPGLPALRDAWKQQILHKNPSLNGKTFSLPVVSAALTHGLSVAGYLFVDPGDTIVLPDLYWDNYDLIFAATYGARLQTHNTFVGGAYDVQALSSALADAPRGKKVVLLNFPNNPTGYTATETEAEAICDALYQAADRGDPLVVLLDDAYFGLVYEDGVARESLFARLADLHPNLLAVKLDGPTKEDYAWSFRVGFISFAFAGATDAQLKALEAKAAGVVRGSISNASGIAQSLLIKTYRSDAYDAQKQTKYDILKARSDKIRDIFSAHPEFAQTFEPMPFNSGYFMCVRTKGADPEAVRQRLLAHYDTGVIVLAGLIRLAFSSVSLADLEVLYQNIHRAVLELQTP